MYTANAAMYIQQQSSSIFEILSLLITTFKYGRLRIFSCNCNIAIIAKGQSLLYISASQIFGLQTVQYLSICQLTKRPMSGKIKFHYSSAHFYYFHYFNLHYIRHIYCLQSHYHSLNYFFKFVLSVLGGILIQMFMYILIYCQ